MIFVTGADGFVGAELCRELNKRNISHVAATRSVYGDMTLQKNWRDLLNGADVVVHLAARVHVMNEVDVNPLDAFRKMNCEATLNLAKAAKLANVKRFIFLSSIKVNGEMTFERPFSSTDKPAPQDAYGISKMEAEVALLAMNVPGEFEVVIIRPPLIYGPGVKANFKSLFELVKKGFPLPFSLVNNKRSLVSLYNLVDLIILCTHHKNAPGKIFFVSDDKDLSLKELIIKMSSVTNRKILLLPIPVSLMKFMATILGKRDYIDRLFGNLQVDISETKKVLDWHPVKTFEETFNKHQ